MSQDGFSNTKTASNTTTASESTTTDAAKSKDSLQPVDIERRDNGLVVVTLNRPEKYNALSIDMFKAIVAAGHSLKNDTSVRAIVLRGAGKGFCAGLDLENFQKMQSESGLFEDGLGEYPNIFQDVAWVWKKMPVPVIAALHGVAYGGGLQIALGADIRIAAPGTKLSVMEIKWGLIPDMSGTQTLRDLTRIDIAKELTFTGRIVLAEEAQRIGLVTFVEDDPFKAAIEMAEAITQKSPDAIAAGKRLFETVWHGEETAGLQAEEKEQTALMGSSNQLEAVFSNLQKRPANYNPRKSQ